MLKLIRAISFVSEKRKNQRRKGHSAHLNHSLALAEVLGIHGIYAEDILVAAVLHDIAPEVTMIEIRSKFGEFVVNLVAEMDNPVSFEAKLIVLADMICNLRDSIKSPRRRNHDNPEVVKAVVDRLRGTHPGMEEDFDKVYRLAKGE